MIDSSFRTLYQRNIIEPLLKLPFLQKTSPHLLTLFALLFGIATLPLLALHHSYLALTALFLTGFFDTLDGSLARLKNLTSDKGAALDITSDRLVEFAILLGLYLYAPAYRALPTILMLGSILFCVTTFLVVGIFSENSSEKSFHYSPGLIERAEAFLFFGVMILFPALYPPLAYLFAALTTLTALIRIKQFSQIN